MVLSSEKQEGIFFSHRLFFIVKMFNECLVRPRHCPEAKGDTKINEHRVCPQGVVVQRKSEVCPIHQQIFKKCLLMPSVFTHQESTGNRVKTLLSCSSSSGEERLTTKKSLYHGTNLVLFTTYCWLSACWAHGDLTLPSSFEVRCGHMTCYGQWHGSRCYVSLEGRRVKSEGTDHHEHSPLLWWPWRQHGKWRTLRESHGWCPLLACS